MVPRNSPDPVSGVDDSRIVLDGKYLYSRPAHTAPTLFKTLRYADFFAESKPDIWKLLSAFPVLSFATMALVVLMTGILVLLTLGRLRPDWGFISGISCFLAGLTCSYIAYSAFMEANAHVYQVALFAEIGNYVSFQLIAGSVGILGCVVVPILASIPQGFADPDEQPDPATGDEDTA
jgi:hypothetical protein